MTALEMLKVLPVMPENHNKNKKLKILKNSVDK